MSPNQPPSNPFYSPFGRISRGAYIGRVLFLGALCVGIVATATGKSVVPGAVLIAAFLLILIQVIKRGRDAGWHWLATVFLVVILNGIALAALAVWPSKRQDEEALDPVEAT